MNASQTAHSDSPARPPESWARMVLRIVAWVAGVGLAGTMAAAKHAGRVRLEGKQYVVQDGDVIEFLFNV